MDAVIEIQTTPYALRVLRNYESASHMARQLHLDDYPADTVVAVVISKSSQAGGDSDDLLLVINVMDGFLAPQLAALPTGGLIVGHNDQVCMVDVAGAAVIEAVGLEAPFYSFLNDAATGIWVAVHELGAVAVHGSTSRWRVSTEIVTDYRLDRGVLQLKDDTGKTLRVDVRSGNVLPAGDVA